MLRDEKINLTMSSMGYFTGLDVLLSGRVVTADEAAKMKAYVFARLSKKVAEMRNEIGRLQGSVERLEAICKHGSLVKPYVPRDSDIGGLRQATGSLHGWTVSLVESDFYLLSALDNRIHAYAKWAKVAKSLEYLQLERQVSMQDISGRGRVPLGIS